MEQLTIIGRILYALPFGVFGCMHFLYAENIGRLIPDFIFGRTLWTYVTGLALLAACISILSKILIRISTAFLAVLLLVFILAIHIPALGSESTFDLGMTGLLKDTALLGASLFICGVYSQLEAHPPERF